MLSKKEIQTNLDNIRGALAHAESDLILAKRKVAALKSDRRYYEKLLKAAPKEDGPQTKEEMLTLYSTCNDVGDAEGADHWREKLEKLGIAV